MITEQTLQHLTDLKLWGMKQAFQHQLESPQTYDLSFEERIGLLLDYETTYRQNKKIERLLALEIVGRNAPCPGRWVLLTSFI